MNNKDMPASEQLLIAEIRHLEKKLARQNRSDLRDFAKAAMQGLCANSSTIDPEYLAKAAVVIAEATLAELERRPTKGEG